jgi:D-alanyl-lipoteichoic acid acyltransferase DltB (MBOAT superfamily)
MTISYVIDVYRRQIQPTTNFIDFALFVAYFPHLVAGPILRASLLLPQIARPRAITRDQIVQGLWLIGWGCFQKMFIADNLADLAGTVFGPSSTPTGLDVLLALYAFAFQIYGDFAGYSNIARGLSKLMGIELNVNFLFPYFVVSPQAFWRNWHISLSTWLRDYLYIPLGGNRGGAWRTTRNLMITMALGGLWHGAAWTFVIWGVSQGGYLVGERVVKQAWARRGAMGLPPPLVKVLQWVLTFNVVCLSWVFFRARSMGGAFEVLGRLIGDGGSSAMVTPLVIGTVLAMLASQFVPQRIPEAVTTKFARAAPVVQILVLGAGLVLIDALGPEGIAPFIYYQF